VVVLVGGSVVVVVVGCSEVVVVCRSVVVGLGQWAGENKGFGEQEFQRDWGGAGEWGP